MKSRLKTAALTTAGIYGIYGMYQMRVKYRLKQYYANVAIVAQNESLACKLLLEILSGEGNKILQKMFRDINTNNHTITNTAETQFKKDILFILYQYDKECLERLVVAERQIEAYQKSIDAKNQCFDQVASTIKKHI